MMGRTPELQAQLGEAMTKLGIQMGVFVDPDRWQQQRPVHDGQAGEPGAVPQGVRGRGRGRQAMQREVDDRGARRVRAQAADRPAARQRHRHAARRRRGPREGQSRDGARAAQRQPRPVPADVGSDLHDLSCGELAGLQDPVRHVPHAEERGAHDPSHRLRVVRDRILPDRRQPGPEGARHRRGQLPQHLQAHRREDAGRVARLRLRHGTRQRVSRQGRRAEGDRRRTSPPTRSRDRET